jgi:hypothetical protein
MKIIILISIILIPILVLGQNTSFSQSSISKEDRLEVNLLLHVSNSINQSIETTLIDDRKWNIPLLDLNFGNHYFFSFTIKNQEFEFYNNPEFGYKNLFEVKPLVDYKLNPENQLLRKDFFD